MIKKGSGLVCAVALGALLGPSCCVLNYLRPLIPCVPPVSHLPSEACLGAQAPVLLRLRGRGGQEGADSERQKTDITEEQARVLLDSAGGEAAALLKTLSDYRESAQVQEQGCKRIVRAFAAVAANISASEDLRSCYVYAGGAKCILESLRVHSHAPLALVTALCKALGVHLDGPPNQSAKGDDVYNDDCVATLVSSYYYICVLMLLYMCPHTTMSSHYYVRRAECESQAGAQVYIVSYGRAGAA